MPDDTTTDPTPEGQEPDDTTAGTTINPTTGTDTGDSTTDAPDEPDSTEPGDDPEKLKAEIARLRKEAAKARVTAKEKAAQEAREAAEKAASEKLAAALKGKDDEHKAMLQKVAKALGLAEEEAPPSPEDLLKAVTAERDTERAAKEARDAKYRDLLREVAVQDAAAMHDANAARLTDSRTFMTRVAELDTDADGFRAAVAELVREAVDTDGDLKVTRKPSPPPVSGGSTVAGTQPVKPEDMTIEQFAALLHPKSRRD